MLRQTRLSEILQTFEVTAGELIRGLGVGHTFRTKQLDMIEEDPLELVISDFLNLNSPGN